jgi:hypothetical protein
MSNKSLFEKLFEDVMEKDALGLPETDMSSAGGDMGGESDAEALGIDQDTVTLTLDKATAEALMSMLKSALGGESEDEGMDGGEEGEGGDESASEDSQSWGEDAEEGEKEEEESEDAEESEEDEDSEEGSLKESPQSEYKPFGNKGEQMTKKGNSKVGGVAGNTSAHGKAAQVSQTSGTEKYMPMNTKYDDGKNNKVKSSVSSPSGPGKSVFNI